METDKIGICVIGAGRAGRIHMQNFAWSVPQAQLVAVADPAEGIAAAAQRDFEILHCYRSYEEALQNEDIDAVVVVSPTVYHKDVVVAAAQAGKHILCEKPMAMNIPECEEMIKAVEENQVKLQLGFMRRFDDNFIAAKKQIEAGAIGDVILIKSLTHGPSIPQRWQYDIAKSNGPLAEVNSHDIDSLRWFTGSEFKEVYAIASNYRCPEAREEFPDFYDNVVLSATFANGMQGVIDGAVSVKYGYDSRMEILGTKGILFVGRLHENSVVVCNSDNAMTRSIVHSWRNLFYEAYRNEDFDFVKCIIEDREPRVSGFDGMMAVKVVNAGNASIKERKPVSLS